MQKADCRLPTAPMTPDQASELTRNSLWLALQIAGPLLVVCLLVGLVVSVFQAVTSIQEQTLSFAPRILALAGLFVVLMPWLLQMSIFYTTQMLARAAQFGQ